MSGASISSPAGLLTIAQASRRLNLSQSTLRAWVLKQKIEYVKLGRSVRITEETIVNLITSHTQPALIGKKVQDVK